MTARVYEYGGDNNRLYYTADPKSIGVMERAWLDNLKKEIVATSEFEHNILVNLTWFKANWDETEPLRKLVASVGPKEKIKIWFAGTVDGNHWITQDHIEFYQYFVQNEYTMSFVGNADEHWHSWYPEWFIGHNLRQRIDVNDLILSESPEYLYLAYNRKPRIHRIQLVTELINNELLDRGWVTFEKGHYPEIDVRTENTDQTLHSADVRFSRPEDILSLGNLEIWKNSYLIIASETDHADPWQLSEKTWKPIFGLRPFLINGGQEVYKILERLGLYTPKDFFKNSDLDCSYTSVASQIKALYSIPAKELYKLWEDQFEMLLYNRKRMFEIAISDPTKILNWPQAKSKP